MSLKLVVATTSIILAAVLYSIAVFAEFRSRDLKLWHLVLFWAGLVFDTTGTTLMGQIADGFQFNIHGILGLLAIVIMLVHAGWASFVRVRGSERLRSRFHHFSITAWTLWMVSFITGFVVGIPSMG